MNAKTRILALRLYEKQKQKLDVFEKMGVEIKIIKMKDERIEKNGQICCGRFRDV